MKVTPVNKKFGKYQPGEAFDLPDKTAKIFVKLGKLAKVESGPAYMTRMMQAEQTPLKVSVTDMAAIVANDVAPYGYKADGTPRQRPGRKAAD